VGVLLSLFFVIFVSGVCLSIYYTCLLFCLFWVCWVRGNFSGGPGRIFSVWDSAVWSAGPVHFYLGTSLEWMAGLYRIYLFRICCSGCGTVEMVGGVVWLSFHFLYVAVSSLGVRLSVVGFCSFISIFCLVFVTFRGRI
jgi:hypothetical protein